MCLNLINSQYKNIDEVEFLLKWNISEERIIAAKDSRKEINKLKKIAKGYEYIDFLGI